MSRPLALAVVPRAPLVVLTRGGEVPLRELSPGEALELAGALKDALGELLDAHPDMVGRGVEDVTVSLVEGAIRSAFHGTPLSRRGRRRRAEGR